MEKVLDWSALNTEEGKFALGYILVEELKTLKTKRDSHIGVSVSIDIFGDVKIGNHEPEFPERFKNLEIDEKLKLLITSNFTEEEIFKVL